MKISTVNNWKKKIKPKNFLKIIKLVLSMKKTHNLLSATQKLHNPNATA